MSGKEERMKSWDKTKLNVTNTQRRVYASEDWDKKFRKIRPQNLNPKFRELFANIKTKYKTDGWLTPKQANAIDVCWKVHSQKEDRRLNMSSRNFGGLSRVVHEPGVY
jgi:hypothetical protein